jgi:serine/threonine-protein kinase
MTDRIRVATAMIAPTAGGPDRRVTARALRAGVWIWPAFTLLDAFMCFVAYTGAPFALFVVYRVVVWLAFFAGYRVSLGEDTDAERLFRWQSLTYSAAALAIALMALHLDGIRSPYMHGISIVALVWAALVPLPWRRSLPTFLRIGLSFPLVIAVAAAVSPAARAEWINAQALTIFASHYVFVLTSCVLGVILSHMVWSAQQRARRLGSYELEELLGRGGMGEVWRARHRLLVRRAAIKLIRPEVLGGDEASRKIVLARFEREAQATASLRSPHTVELYDFGVSDTGAFYYVMELLEGLDLGDLVDRWGPMPAERVIYVLRQMCDSLGEAHVAGLVHRDIKPSNVLLCRYGRAVDFVKVLDFGLVKPREARGKELTADHVVSGTPAFMSPEQVLGDRPVDARTDLYAVGCVAYWLLTGKNVFEGDNAMQVMTEHARGTPVPPSRRADRSVPTDLERLVMACLEKDPDDRPRSADALAEGLDALPMNGSWTRERARQWWERFRPDSVVDELAHIATDGSWTEGSFQESPPSS